jgi:hypothetical protein
MVPYREFAGQSVCDGPTGANRRRSIGLAYPMQRHSRGPFPIADCRWPVTRPWISRKRIRYCFDDHDAFEGPMKKLMEMLI